MGGVTIRIAPGTTAHALPGGILLRLALLHICDRAARAGNAVVEMGDSAATLAATMGPGVDAGALADQVERALAAKISLSLGNGADLGVFDARGRPRTAGAAWRPTIRLNNGFVASLAEHAVPLERRIVALLHDAPLAFDAYAWIRQSLHGKPAGFAVTAAWDDLLARFGTSAQAPDAFRSGFEAALRVVFEADHAIALAVDDDGVVASHGVEQAEAAGADVGKAAPVTAHEAPAPKPEPTPAPTPAPPQAAASPAGPQSDSRAEAPEGDANDIIPDDTISLLSRQTGLDQVIWLRRGYGPDSALVGVTPGARFDVERLTVLALEPIVVEVSGALGEQALSRVSAWVAVNRDLIDDFWAGEVTTFTEINRRMRKVPALGWR